MSKRGRPCTYSEALASEICTRLIAGESLNFICSDPRMPPESTVRLWVLDDRGSDQNGRQGFAAKYARARDAGLEKMAESIIDISDDDYSLPDGSIDGAAVQQARLRVDARKWYLSKLLPRRFGDKIVQELTSDPDRPLLTRIELVAVVPQHRLPKDDETAITEAAVVPLRAVTAR